MTIKSDKWIKRQCMAPSFVVQTLVPQAQHPMGDVYMIPYEQWIPSWATVEQLEDQIREHKVLDCRPLTAEEVLAFKPMIEPFEPSQVRQLEGNKVISYGLSSYGYDIRASDEFKVFTNINSTIVDPKNFDPGCFVDVSGKGYCIIPPNSFALARTVEYFRIPRNVLTICLGKSTYARCGIVVNVTPFEPEWEGHVTLEFSNTTPLPAKIYANEGVAQVMFFESDEDCEVSYKDRQGKYQGQQGVTVPRV